ncbi:FKBP-type peptidyl-prolyl cis-trans isomerase [Phenylobacterium sp.]|uniref:FKBP-type peptidyl-prolyl cis-trans isomerase n=1 Tax=Phenylobacterium sp. TaxID=1871053 RepID=UPI00286C0722|nr:FKBP-type peptidyl-prolyl cis-trans isomerase [Phenylobacterium sp.]
MKILALALAAALACALPAAADPGKANAEFLARNAKAKGVKSLPAIQYEILRSGPADGVQPTRASTIRVRYEGRFVDGVVFDASAKGSPDGIATFPLQRLIPGWVTVLQQMRPGDEWRVVIPPDFAYGAKGKDIIPPDSILIFKIELVEVQPTPPTP